MFEQKKVNVDPKKEGGSESGRPLRKGGDDFFYFPNTRLASTSNWETASRSHFQAAATIHSMETSSGVEADRGESHLNCQAPLQLSQGTPSLACPENV